jgi:hypothetical protein
MGPGDDVVSYKPSLKSLPSQMAIEVLDDELVITRRWFGWGHIALGIIVFFLLTFGLFFSEVQTLEFVINPLTWLVSGLGYYLLRRLINVERFAVQVGNDTDPVRQEFYRFMRCVISPDCRLSDNTIRILRRTFGQVDDTAISPVSQEQRHIAAQLLDQEDERFDASH